jgi:hypothetical protein
MIIPSLKIPATALQGGDFVEKPIRKQFRDFLDSLERTGGEK